MSTADKIGKLDELRKQGLITDEEFDERARNLLGGHKKRKGLWWKIPLGLFGVFIVISVFSSNDQPTPPKFLHSVRLSRRLPHLCKTSSKDVLDSRRSEMQSLADSVGFE